MGFGPLLVGYLFQLNPGVYSEFSNFLSYLLMFYGMLSLRVYNKGLKAAFTSLFPLLILGLCDFVLKGREFLGYPPSSAELNTAMAIGTRILTLLFTVLLFHGVEDLAIETDLPEIRAAAVRNRVFSYIFYIAAAALEVSAVTEEASLFARSAVIPIVIAGFIVVLLNALTLFRCFRYIGLPNDTDADNHP